MFSKINQMLKHGSCPEGGSCTSCRVCLFAFAWLSHTVRVSRCDQPARVPCHEKTSISERHMEPAVWHAETKEAGSDGDRHSNRPHLISGGMRGQRGGRHGHGRVGLHISTTPTNICFTYRTLAIFLEWLSIKPYTHHFCSFYGLCKTVISAC